MKVTSNPRLARTSTITKPLRTAWVEGARPLIHPAGPDCGFMIQAVMIVAADHGRPKRKRGNRRGRRSETRTSIVDGAAAMAPPS